MPALGGPGTRRLHAVAAVVLALVLPLVALAGCGRSGTASTGVAGSGVTATGGAARLAPPRAVSGLPSVTVDALPAEAVTTLRLIAAGGPFPYPKDGVTFGNRERLLPSRPNGFYKEYTVVTPGSSDRGARRVVTGNDGSRYYTDDHYDSFREVVQP